MSTTKAPRQAQPASPAALDKRDVVSNMTRFMDARSIRSMQMTQRKWSLGGAETALPPCVDKEAWRRADRKACTRGRWDFHPSTITQAALCAWQPFQDRAQPLRLYVRSEDEHEFKRNDTVRCMAEHAFPMEVTLLHSPTQAALQDQIVREAASALVQLRIDQADDIVFNSDIADMSRQAMDAAALVARKYIDKAQPLFDNLTQPRTLLVADVGSAQQGFASDEHRLLAQTIRFSGDRTEILEREFACMTNLVELPPRMSNLQLIDHFAFQECTGLRELGRMDALRTIGPGAFSGCTGLRTLGDMNALTTIGERAFHGCTGLIAVDQMDALKTIGMSAFADCTGLTTLGDMNNLNTIDRGGFYGCENLETVGRMDALVTIGEGAFENCTMLTRMGQMDALETIENSAFRGCLLLTELRRMDALRTIRREAFADCMGLIKLGDMNSLRNIRREAFRNCTRLEELGQMKDLDTIETSAFSGCVDLQRFEIPRTMDHVGESAFAHCPLEYFTIEPGEFRFECFDDTLLQKLRAHPRVNTDGSIVNVVEVNGARHPDLFP